MATKKFSAVAAGAVLALGCVGNASALSLLAGDYKINFDNFDSGTQYGTTIGALCGGVTNSAVNRGACDGVASPAAPGATILGSVNPSADTMGILSVSSISSLSIGADVYNRGTAGFINGVAVGPYLTGVFGNLVDFYVENSGSVVLGVTTTTLSAGGTFNIYNNATDYDPTTGPAGAGVDLNGLLYPPSITPGSALFLGGVFAAASALAGTDAAYVSTFRPSTLAGSGVGFLDFTGGTALAIFDTNGTANNTGGFNDAKLTTTFSPNATSAVNGWTVFSTSDVTGQAIPEPASLMLVGLALLGLGASARRRT